jgi:hypothetical protein
MLHAPLLRHNHFLMWDKGRGMRTLSIYTKRINLADTPAVRRWGVGGARRFWLGWCALLYVMLALLNGYGLTALAMAEDERPSRFILYLAAVLIVLAASLLTRMLVRVLGELRRLDVSAKKDGNRN